MMARMRWLARIWTLVLATTLGLAPALSGEFTLVSMQYSRTHPVPHIHYEGEVLADDLAKLEAIYEFFVRCRAECLPQDGGSTAVLTLDSIGGVYRAGLGMAEFLRENHVASVIEEDMACYSACAFAFLGGSGWSPTPSVGTYVDRVLEPGGVLAFHAPYFNETDFREAVMSAGGFAVQSWSRNDFALMVGELVRYNVSPQILSLLVGMGPEDFYYVRTGADHFLMRVALPPVPARLWQTGGPAALRNACVRLLALFEGVDPYWIEPWLTADYEQDAWRDAAGTRLSGFRISDSLIGPGHCAAPTAEIVAGGNIDAALYMNGVLGHSVPLYEMFSRDDGWSSAGPGGLVSGRVFQRGPLSHFYTPIAARIEDIASGARIAMRADRFVSLLPARLHTIEVPLEPVAQDRSGRISRQGDVWVFEQTGPAALFTAAAEDPGRIGQRLAYDLASASGFVREGFFADGTAFATTGFSDGAQAAVIRIMVLKPEGVAATPAELALMRRIVCGARFGPLGNSC